MKEVAEAFAVLGWLVKVRHHGGRRLLNMERAVRTRWIPITHGSPMLTAHMAPRRERRARQGKNFISVYGYRR